MNLDLCHQLITQSLNQITGLEAPTVPVSVSLETPRHIVAVLKRDYKTEVDLSEPLSDEEEAYELSNYPALINILDLMGVYKHDYGDNAEKSCIILYDEVIWTVARENDLPFSVLKHKVLIHETAHAVTHLGRDSQGEIWKNFASASTDDKEFFAQIYTYLLFKAATMGDDLKGYLPLMNSNHPDIWPRDFYNPSFYIESMEKLSQTQPEQYKTWIPEKNQAPEVINSRLRAVRNASNRKSPFTRFS